MTPAALQRGATVEPIGVDLWLERQGQAITLHACDRTLLCRVAVRVGQIGTPRRAPRAWTMYFGAVRAERAITIAKAYALPLVDGTRATRNGYRPRVANGNGGWS